MRRRVPRCVHDVQVFARDGRFAPSAKLVWDPRDGEELIVRLLPLCTATVRVVTRDGEPVAGTELWTLQPIEAVPGAPATAAWREVPMPGRPDPELDASTRWARQGIDDAPLGTARTDATGRASVVVPADTDVLIAAFGPRHVPNAIVGRAAAGEDIELRVAAGATLRVVLSPKEVVHRLVRASRRQRVADSGSKDFVYGGMELQIARAADGAESQPSSKQSSYRSRRTACASIEDCCPASTTSRSQASSTRGGS